MNDPHPRLHSFHIPVMGLGYTIDTPLKVAHYGIASVVSIIEDELVERMRAFHCQREGEVFVPIPKSELDHRAQRVTAYLNLLQRLVDRNTEALRRQSFDAGTDINKYFEMLADDSPLKRSYDAMVAMGPGTEKEIAREELRKAIVPGAIDVNIMAKIDRTNYDRNGVPLPVEYADAMAAFRGFAKSDLRSSVVFSAGYNPRLYGYIEQFDDFMPDEQGELKKRIILKVSDARSALIQGKLLAKKGLWVSEFRVESGLNCGGHAFATDGVLMGPILDEFHQQRGAMAAELLELCNRSLEAKGSKTFVQQPVLRITAQGGIGTMAEDRFLREHYGLDGTGWGSPFLLVPEATNVDAHTLEQLAAAKPDDYYMSWASPLGIPFHNFRPSTSELQRQARIAKGRPGSPCYKEHLSTDTEFTTISICTASRQYQDLKIKQLKEQGLEGAAYQRAFAAITEKDCLCEGLGASALLNEGITPAHKLEAVAICPGPNMAYFSKVVPLRTMVDHIYGRVNLLNTNERPHMFVKELSLYMTYLRRELGLVSEAVTVKQQRYFTTFRSNLIEGIRYYEELIPVLRARASADVQRMRTDLERMVHELEDLVLPEVVAVG